MGETWKDLFVVHINLFKLDAKIYLRFGYFIENMHWDNPRENEPAAYAFPGQHINKTFYEKIQGQEKEDEIPDSIHTAQKSEYKTKDKEFLCAWSMELIMMGDTLK